MLADGILVADYQVFVQPGKSKKQKKKKIYLVKYAQREVFGQLCRGTLSPRYRAETSSWHAR